MSGPSGACSTVSEEVHSPRPHRYLLGHSRLLKHSEGGDWLYSEAMAVCPSRRDICIKCQARIEDPSNTANGLLFVAGDQRAFPRPLGCPQRSFGGKVREPWSTCRPDPTVGEPGRGEGKGFVRGLPGRQGRSWEQTQAFCVLFHLLFSPTNSGS